MVPSFLNFFNIAYQSLRFWDMFTYQSLNFQIGASLYLKLSYYNKSVHMFLFVAKCSLNFQILAFLTFCFIFSLDQLNLSSSFALCVIVLLGCWVFCRDYCHGVFDWVEVQKSRLLTDFLLETLMVLHYYYIDGLLLPFIFCGSQI